MKHLTLIVAALLAFVAPALATTYAVPDNGNTANDCVTGYACLDSTTPQTFSIGLLSFPPPYLQVTTSSDLASHGIFAVVDLGAPAGNFANVTHSIQMVGGVPTVVYVTTPAPTPTPQQIAQAALDAGLTVTCASGATVCTSTITGTYSLSATAQANVSGVIAGIGAGQGLPGGGSTFLYLDRDGSPHPFTAAQITEFYNAGRNFIYMLDLFAAGAGTQPSATVALP